MKHTPKSGHPYTEQHEAFRASLRRFVERELSPQIEAWEEAKSFPRELYRKASEIGLLAIGFPEAFGGIPADPYYTILVSEEMARTGSGGIMAGLMSHSIGLPPVVALGSPELKQRIVPQVLAGEAISALAVTEPSGGSDVANLRTTAVRDGDHFVVNGDKTFITSGMRADYLTTAVRTGVGADPTRCPRTPSPWSSHRARDCATNRGGLPRAAHARARCSTSRPA